MDLQIKMIVCESNNLKNNILYFIILFLQTSKLSPSYILDFVRFLAVSLKSSFNV